MAPFGRDRARAPSTTPEQTGPVVIKLDIAQDTGMTFSSIATSFKRNGIMAPEWVYGIIHWITLAFSAVVMLVEAIGMFLIGIAWSLIRTGTKVFGPPALMVGNFYFTGSYLGLIMTHEIEGGLIFGVSSNFITENIPWAVAFGLNAAGYILMDRIKESGFTQLFKGSSTDISTNVIMILFTIGDAVSAVGGAMFSLYGDKYLTQIMPIPGDENFAAATVLVAVLVLAIAIGTDLIVSKVIFGNSMNGEYGADLSAEVAALQEHHKVADNVELTEQQARSIIEGNRVNKALREASAARRRSVEPTMSTSAAVPLANDGDEEPDWAKSSISSSNGNGTH